MSKFLIKNNYLTTSLNNISSHGIGVLRNYALDDLVGNDGIILSSRLPPIAISTISICTDIDAMHALAGSLQSGDSVKVLDTEEFYIYDGENFIKIIFKQAMNLLEDTIITSPQVGQNIVYNGNKWSNQTPTLMSNSDVVITNPQQNQLMMYDNGVWKNNILNDIPNSEITNPSNGQVLAYNAGKWKNKTIQISDLSNISFPANKQYLGFQDGVWTNLVPYTSPLTTIGDLLMYNNGADTRLPIGTSGQFLKVNSGLPTWTTILQLPTPTTDNKILVSSSSQWIEGNHPLPNVSLTSPVTGDYLKFDGTNWINQADSFVGTLQNGDLVNSTGSGFHRLPIGTTGQFLRVNGSVGWSTFQSLGTGTPLQVTDGVKSLSVAGTLSISSTSTDVTLTGTGEINTASSLGGTSIVGTKSGSNIPFKGLVAGTNITLTDSGTTITINASGSSLTSDPVVIGSGASASATSSVCIGKNSSIPSGNNNTAIGNNATIGTNQIYSMAIGSSCATSGDSNHYGIAIGSLSTASKYQSTAIGYNSLCASRYSFALGNSCCATSADNSGNQYNLSLGNGVGGRGGFGLQTSTTNTYITAVGNNILNYNPITSNVNNLLYLGNNIHLNEIGSISNSIVLNSSSTQVNSINSDSCYINPVRANAGTWAVKYNPSTFEVTYDTGASSRRLKKDVTTTQADGSILQDLKKIRIVDFKYLDDECYCCESLNGIEQKRCGVIAEELAMLPNFQSCINIIEKITMSGTDYVNVPAVSYEKLFLKTIIAVQQLTKIVENQQLVINRLL